MVLLGVDRPDDVRHRVDEVAGETGDVGQRLLRAPSVPSRVTPRDLGEDRDLREGRPDVVVQVRRDAAADPLDLEDTPEARAVERGGRERDEKRGGPEDGPAAPEGGRDREADARGHAPRRAL